MTTMHQDPHAFLLRPQSRVVVVGGCGGIGRAVVAALAARTRVAVLDLPASIARHPPPAGVKIIACDAADANSVMAAFGELQAAWDGLDAFVNLCGFKLETLKLGDTPPDIWDEGIAGNLRSAYLLSRAALPLLTQAGGGTMVHVTSGLGSYGGVGYGPYAVAKGGINTLVRILMREYAPHIRVNAVAPGYVLTAFARGGTGRSDETAPPHIDAEKYSQQIPLGRAADPSDLVGPILFLLGPASAYVNGQILHVNGGGYLP